jgi:hypothetical protein
VSASTSSGRFPDFRFALRICQWRIRRACPPRTPQNHARIPATADYSGGTVADFHGLPQKLKSLPTDFNFYLRARQTHPKGFPEPAKLSSASVCASAFAVNEMERLRDPSV